MKVREMLNAPTRSALTILMTDVELKRRFQHEL